MEKIRPLLLLLLLLIFFCTSQKMDKLTLTIPQQKEHSTPMIVLSEEKAIDFVIKQKLTSYTLNGNFTNTEQQDHLSRLFEIQKGKLLLENTSTNETLASKGGIALVRELIPLFVKEYNNGVVSYGDETLIVEGEVNSYEIKHQMQQILASSPVPSQNNTKVVLPIPINFRLLHTEEKNILSGNFMNKAQEEALQKIFTTLNAPFSISQASENPKLIDSGAVDLVTNILPDFIQNYTDGEISYQDNQLTVKGKVKNKKTLTKIETLLTNAKIATTNLSMLNKKYLQKIADLKREEEEARLIEENQRLQKEKMQLEQEAAEEARIEEEKAAETARLEEEKKRAELQKAQEEAAAVAEQARLEEEKRREEQEKERISQEKELQLAREATEKRMAEEKEAKANILKLLQVENIEFNTAKATLTQKGQLTVDKLASILKKYPNVKIEIAGHTDADGSETFNETLSQSRVDTVKKELISQGVAAKHLTAKGYGESKPLVPNTTDENKQKNRRVEINIIGE